MDIKPIKTEEDNRAALARIEQLWNAQPNTVAADELEVLVTLVHSYEATYCPIALPDPIDAILFRIEQLGLAKADLIPFLGPQSRVTEVLNRERDLSLTMIHRLHKGLNISLETLIQEYHYGKILNQ